jgi:histidine triad (HIT) family protein
MDNCIFCRIARKEASAELITETDNVISFMDIGPRAPGHSLVIPKRHAEKLTELDDELIAEVFRMTKEVVKVLEKALKPDAFTIGINDGKAAGQEVPHLHVNIIPRFNGDGGKPIHAVVHNPIKEEISKTAERVRAAIQ